MLTSRFKKSKQRNFIQGEIEIDGEKERERERLREVERHRRRERVGLERERDSVCERMREGKMCIW